MIERHLSLSALLEHDKSSYEYFNSLPPALQYELNKHEIASFEELQRKAVEIKKSGEISTL